MISTFHNVGQETLFIQKCFTMCSKETLFETNTFHNVGRKTLWPCLMAGLFTWRKYGRTFNILW